MDDLLHEFLTETSENLAVLDVELVRFEQDPSDAAMLGNIFRLVHTIKGTCGFLGLGRLEAVAHAGENILGKFRDRELPVTQEAVSLILKCIDRIRYILAELEAAGAEPQGDDSALIAELNAHAEGRAAPAPAPASATTLPGSAESTPVISEDGFPVAAELLAEIESALAGSSGGPAEPLSAEVPSDGEHQAPPSLNGNEAKETAASAASIRVNVDVLEGLMTLVSELVLTRNQLLQMVRGQDDSAFNVPLQRLSHITSDLQEGVMKTRMQPIGNAWAKLPRIVRDLSVEMGKKIELVLEGAETELDRQVLELIKDPLTHMVRNSADHGLESPQERIAVGKSETGRITLKAYHEGGQIIIVVADDGRGLHDRKIRAKALANKLATAAEIEGMTEQQVMQFIFRPGFSTAEKVTNVSGRGVGMDVVRNNIERIGGAIELTSKAGAGSSFTIKIPLTLAIVSALIVGADNDRFAIPQLNVVELVRVSPKSDTRIEMVHASPVLRLRERLLPLVSLRKLFKLGGTEDVKQQELFVVVVQVGTHQFGILVDRVFDTEEIVVKPVSPILRDVPFYSGNTILGDGSVIMILDPNGIASAAGQTRVGSGDDNRDTKTEVEEGQAKMSFLLFRAGSDELKAVPLALVARLEQIDLALAERVHGRYVVQYRERLMPLVPFDPNHQWRSEGRQPVLVFTESERSIGMVVDQIVDIVEDHMSVELSSATPGLVGSAIIAGKATDIVDVGYYLTKGLTEWFGSPNAVAGSASRNILLVDDSAFFRNLLTPVLSVAGWHVSAVEGPHEALALREAGKTFDVIISDIEMPRMDGLAFAAEVRSDPRWANIPLVALSTRVAKEDISEALKAGFDTYVAKASRDILLNVLSGLAPARQQPEAAGPKNGGDDADRGFRAA